jgi:hypothetical protein
MKISNLKNEKTDTRQSIGFKHEMLRPRACKLKQIEQPNYFWYMAATLLAPV